MMILDKGAVEDIYTLDKGIPLISDALIQISSDRAKRSGDILLPPEGEDRIRLSAAAYRECMVAAVLVSPLFKDAAGAGRDLILYDLSTGRRIAIVDFLALSRARNATLAAIATDTLAPTDAKSLAVVGHGGDTGSLVRAVCHVRDIEKVTIWTSDAEAAERYADAIRRSRRLEAVPCRTYYEALNSADIICIGSLPEGSLIGLADVREGAHINLLSSSEEAPRTVTSGLIAAAKVYVEDSRIAMDSRGNLVAAMKDGTVTCDDIAGEIGLVLSGQLMRPREKRGITIFEAWGHSREDLMMARHIFDEIVRRRTDEGDPAGHGQGGQDETG